MNRTRASRLTALLTAVLFFLAWGGEAVGVHPCPHHSGIHSDPAAHADAGHHADPAAHAHAGHQAPQQDAPEHGGCTCVSGCPSAAGALLHAPRVVAAEWRTLEWTAPRAFPPAQSSAPRFLPYLLPYGQAPPPG